MEAILVVATESRQLYRQNRQLQKQLSTEQGSEIEWAANVVCGESFPT